MPAVNWDKPSTGLVNDASPSLMLTNGQGRGLAVKSEGIGVDAVSKSHEALRATTKTTLTARFTSDQSSAVMASAPQQFAVAGVNFSDKLPAIIGVSGADPSLPPDDQLGGIGVAGITDRAAATGVLGAALRMRSTGVLGRAELGTGVKGEGGTGPGVVGISKNSHGVEAMTTGPNAAGVRATSNAGPGVDATAVAFPGITAESAQAEGVVGEAHVANAAGVRGVNTGNGGIGVAGSVQNGTGISATASNGVCIDALSFNADGIHVDTTNGVGIKVSAFTKLAVDAFSGTAAAVQAHSVVAPAVDAVGLSTGVNGATVGGADPNDLKKGCGVFGTSLAHAGVCGVSITGSGVMGICPPQLGFAGRFRGNVFVEGWLFKYANAFSIDHPLDPDRKLLQHAAIEAPELKTFYDGIATLDRSGRARVRLPKWFGALNRDVRYQLTSLGKPAPDLHVASEVKNNSFVIGGGRPGQRVSWQLTGVRQDAWARSNPLQIECTKPTDRRTPAITKRVFEKLNQDLRSQAHLLKGRSKVLRKKQPELKRSAVRVRDRVPRPGTPEGVDPNVSLAAVRALAKADSNVPD